MLRHTKSVSIFSYFTEIFKKCDFLIFALKYSNITHALLKDSFAAKISEQFILSNTSELYILVLTIIHLM